ncbi:uncharacterized protein LOC120902189 isoform X2 [Anopheles arabiensis]|uniref:uncharacterized protein LOC120902189 isoform X2 n=1 Tax=Anopheles arabiensis TaxID=7173 RepID=UPI001AAE0D34|nr:uncharacterized protein LOC120902189 isoform X2 [Anopheles arabiensis]
MEHEHELKAPPAVAQTNESQQPETGALDHRPLAPVVDSLHFRSFAPTGQAWMVTSSLESVDHSRSHASLGAVLLLRGPQHRLTSEVREVSASACHGQRSVHLERPPRTCNNQRHRRDALRQEPCHGQWTLNLERSSRTLNYQRHRRTALLWEPYCGRPSRNVHQPTPSHHTPGRTMADKHAESSGAVCALELRMWNLTRRKLELEIRELEFEEQLILAESRRISDGFISMIDDEARTSKSEPHALSSTERSFRRLQLPCLCCVP